MLQPRCFPVNFAKFLRTPFRQSTYERLLPKNIRLLKCNECSTKCFERLESRHYYIVFLASLLLNGQNLEFEEVDIHKETVVHQWLLLNFAKSSKRTSLHTTSGRLLLSCGLSRFTLVSTIILS